MSSRLITTASASRQHLANSNLPLLITVLTLGTVVYLAFLILRPDLDSPLWPTHLALITIAILVGVRSLLFWRPLTFSGTDPMVALLAGLVLVNCAAALQVSPNEATSVYPETALALLVAGCGGLVVTWRWLLAITSIIWLVFLGFALLLHPWDLQGVGIMSAATMLAFLLKRSMRRGSAASTAPRNPTEPLRDLAREAMLAVRPFEGLIIHDHGWICQVNESVTAMFGYTTEELTRLEITGLLGNESRRMVSDSLRLGSFRPFEGVCVRKNGTTFHAEIFSKIMPFEGRDLVVTAIRDISDRKRAENALEEERARLDLLCQRQAALAEIELALDHPAELQATLDRIVRLAGQYLPASAGTCLLLCDENTSQLYLAASTVPLPESPWEKPGPQAPGRAVRWILEQKESLVVSNLGSDPFEITKLFPGIEIQAFAGIPMTTTGAILGVLFALETEPRVLKKEDLDFLRSLVGKTATLLVKVRLFATLQEANQDLARQRAELEQTVAQLDQAKTTAESASRAKSDFLLNVSRELRPPLSAILGVTNQFFLSCLTDEQNQFALALRDNASALLSHVNLISDFAQISAGQLVVRSRDFDLHEVLKNIVRTYLGAAERKHLDFHLRVADDAPRFLRGDALRLEQILAQLVSNAIKFTEHGQVVVTITRIPNVTSDITLAFSVADTGIGIAAEDQTRLWEPFPKLEPAVSRRLVGLGLGLAFCRELVKLMGGEIHVESELGSGSDFRFILPFAGAAIFKD